MPYFRDIAELAEQVSLWADLRNEQGLDPGRVLDRVRRELRRAARALERQAPPAAASPLTQSHPAIRELAEYQTLWEALSQVHQEDPDGNVYH